jgi:hypothetical protein
MIQHLELYETFFDTVSTSENARKDAELMQYVCDVIIQKTKSRRMRWVEDVERMGKKRNSYKVLIEKLEQVACKT